MKDGIFPENKKRRLPFMPCVKDYSKRIRPQWVNFQSLPEAIVSRIISRLTLKEAVRMSTISSDFRRAWIYHPNLFFSTLTVCGSSDWNKRILSAKRFIETVNLILTNHSGLAVNKLSVKFELRKEHANDIDGWVSFAIASKATAVILNFSPYRGSYENNYNFPCHLFNDKNGSHLKVVCLDSVTLGPTQDFCGFANLTMLTLEHVLVLGDLLYLPKFPALEWLKIRMCFQLHNLCTSEPLLRLKFLCVQDCAIEKIELHAPNLTTFKYRGRFTVVIALHECLKLKTASIVSPFEDNLGYIFTGLPNGLPHVERLHVEVLVNTQIPGFTQPPLRFIHLRHMTMRITFGAAKRLGKNAVLQLAHLLEAAPFLADLHLDTLCVDHCDYPPDRGVIMHRPHYNLKRAFMTGFIGTRGQVALAKFILRNAVKLERMTIDPKGRILRNHIVLELVGRGVAKEEVVPKDKNGVLLIL